MKGKKFKPVIGVIASIVLIAICFVGYKSYCLNLYDLNSNENCKDFVKNLTLEEPITINHSDVKDNDYLSFRNVKIRNDFADFEQSDEYQLEDESVRYVNKAKDAAFWMSTFASYVELMKESNKTYYNSDMSSNYDYTGFLNENNITKDTELIEYLVNNKDTKHNIFTSVDKMKERYYVYSFASILMQKKMALIK